MKIPNAVRKMKMKINKILANSVIIASLVGCNGCAIKIPVEIPSHIFAKHEVHKYIEKNSEEKEITRFEIGDQNYIQFKVLRNEFKGKNITLRDTIRYPNTDDFKKEFYEDGRIEAMNLNSDATVIIYGNIDSLDKHKFYDKAGNLSFPKIIDGINFLSDLERKIAIEKEASKHIGTIDFGIVGQLRLENKFSKQSIYDALSLWYPNTTMLAIQKTIDSAKEMNATQVYFELSGTSPDGIRLSGSFSGGLFFSTGKIENQSDYLIKAIAELYK